MRRFGFSLAAAALVALAAPLSAHAAPPKEAAAKPYEKEALAKGAKEGPAVLAKAGLTCTSTGFAFSGQGQVKDPTTKKDIKQNVYEVSCKEGLGYSLIETVGVGTVDKYDCVTLADAAKSAVKCRLPGNLDARSQLQPLMTATGRTCTVADARPIGATKSGEAYYEVGCSGATGYVIKTSNGGKPEATPCALELGSSLECKLTTKEQIAAEEKAKVTALVAKSGKTCAISGQRTVGQLKSGDDLYEVACGAAGGFMLQTSTDMSRVTAVDCGKADAMFQGGCTLTNAAVSQNKESATYTRLANAAGFPCDVTGYRFIGVDAKSKSELVELACKNRKDGGMGLFPADNSKGTVYDCVAAETFGQKCRLSQASAAYDKYTQALKAKGKTTCTVSNARFVGRTEAGSDYVETACADGAPGWVVELARNSVKELLTCSQAKGAGMACQLPGNAK